MLDGRANWPDTTSSASAGELEQDEFNLPDEVDVTGEATEIADTKLEFDEDDYPLSPDDVALLLSDEPKLEGLMEMPAHFHADHAELAELMEDVKQQPELVVDSGSVAGDEESYEVESIEAWQELADQTVEPTLSEAVPDLDLELQEDLSVSRVSAATLSVENPSKVLEEYPDLEFSDEAAQPDDTDDELEDDTLVVSDDAADSAEQTRQANEDIAAELDALDGTDFDALLADYAQTDTEDRLADEQIADVVLSELNPEPVEASVQATEAEPPLVLKQAQSDDLEFSLLALDKLLDDSEDEPQQHQNAVRTSDVGLEDYQDFIAAQHEPELDPAEQGFAADLDLIRAYIEIGEQDGAEHLIDKVLSSAAPEHIKQEAQSLKDQL